MGIYSVKVSLFPEAPEEIREFQTLKEAKTWAVHRRLALRQEFYRIRVMYGETELEILIGSIYRGLHS